jgi:hypothetical protein
MSAGITVFLRLASPSGGRLHAPGASWLLAGLITLGAVLVAVAAASGPGHRPGASSTRRAALLGSATGIAWGFVAAVIKELSSHLGGGIGAVFSTWSLYLLLAAGAAAMLLASHALAAGPRQWLPCSCGELSSQRPPGPREGPSWLVCQPFTDEFHAGPRSSQVALHPSAPG